MSETRGPNISSLQYRSPSWGWVQQTFLEQTGEVCPSADQNLQERLCVHWSNVPAQVRQVTDSAKRMLVFYISVM
jgi:hypothetical protein